MIITTGGALAVRRALGLRDDQPAAPQGDLELVVEEFANVPGSHLTPAQIAALAQRVATLRPAAAGVVVVTGSDTLEEAAYLLDLLLPAGPPLVVTSMPRLTAAGADGSAGLGAALQVAAAPAAADLGALVVLDGEIHAAALVQEQRGEGVRRFASPAGGPLGYVAGAQVRLLLRPAARQHIAAPRLVEPVDLIRIGLGADDRALRHSIADGVAGVVIEALGSGRVPPWWLPTIAEAIQRRIAVVIAGRAPASGALGDTYGYVGAYHDLRKLGVVFAPDLGGLKARLKLMAALGLARTPAELRALFA